VILADESRIESAAIEGGRVGDVGWPLDRAAGAN